MSIKYISFDLDDTFWDVMPTIYRAEDLTSSWIKENYPGADKIIQSTNMMDLRNKLLKEDPSLLVKISVFTLQRSNVVLIMSAQIAATVIDLPLIDPELSTKIETLVSLNSISFSTL